MVPFYCWKLTHHWHHRNTCNIDKDEVFNPLRKVDENDHVERRYIPYFGLGLGWATYLIFGYDTKKVFCHLNPFDARYQGFQAKCLLSVSSVVAMGFCLYKYTLYDGFLRLVVYYLIPWFGFGTWVVILTFLHHHDVDITWYGNDQWTFVKGALSSIDRDYGLFHRMIHHIGTHQVHHLFISVPHYHLERATVHFRAKYPHLVKLNKEPIFTTFHTMWYAWLNQYIVGTKTTEVTYK